MSPSPKKPLAQCTSWTGGFFVFGFQRHFADTSLDSCRWRRLFLTKRNVFAEISEIQASTQTTRCKVHKALRWLDAELSRQVQDALLDIEGTTGRAIASWLTREGFQISERSVQRHRGGSCGCS